MEAEITGSIPRVLENAKLGVLDFQEHYTRVSPGIQPHLITTLCWMDTINKHIFKSSLCFRLFQIPVQANNRGYREL